jgi:hypothetical protein
VTPTATYLYAITRPVDDDLVAGLRGVGDAPVRVVRHGDLACLVSTVDLADFGEQSWTQHLEDVAWLARTASAHDDVVRAVARVAATVPLRMATICTDDTAVRARLDAVRETTLRALAAVDGRDEWGVKLFASPDPEAAEPAASSGTAYLQQRRRTLERRESALQAGARTAETVYARLVDVAAGSCRHRLQDSRLSGDPRPMVLNAAFLVDRAREHAFRAAVSELAADRAPGALVLTGPWPPYSFVPTEPS